MAQKVEVITTVIQDNNEASYNVISFDGNGLDLFNGNFNVMFDIEDINCLQKDDTCEFFNPYGFEENCLADDVYVGIMTYIKTFKPTIFWPSKMFLIYPFYDRPLD